MVQLILDNESLEMNIMKIKESLDKLLTILEYKKTIYRFNNSKHVLIL